MSRDHLLRQLSLPDRYERLASRLGSEVVQILVPPEQALVDSLERVAMAVRTRDEGILLPAHGESGVGKTTLFDNLTHFLPRHFTQTLNYQGDLTFDELLKRSQEFIRGYPADEKRILPINVDQREAYAPNARELSEIKRFLRTADLALRPIVLWPDTNADNAGDISRRYIEVAGEPPIPLPLGISGPPREAWRDIARNTLRLANDIDSLEQLGVNPADYSPQSFAALGGMLRKISTDFDNLRFRLQKDTRKEISLVIVFPSESQEPGILSQLTSSSRYGLLDSQALIGVTATSELGRWWTARRGLLTRAIVQLNAHALFLAPGVSVGFLRRYGTDDIKRALENSGVKNISVARIARDLSRSDFGKFLLGEEIRAYEARGTPAQSSVKAFRSVGELGFIQGKDKKLNAAAGAALETCLPTIGTTGVQADRVSVEEQLDFCSLLPDNALYISDSVVCVEYHWRNGDFLQPRNRSAAAQYILKKLRDYARQLGWTAD